MTDEPRWLQERPGPLKRRITRLLARAWPEDEVDRKLAEITPEAIAKGNGHLIEQAQYALDKETAAAVLDRAFLLSNLGVGCIVTIIVLARAVPEARVAIEALSIPTVHAAGVWLATREPERVREIGRCALLLGTGMGIGLV